MPEQPGGVPIATASCTASLRGKTVGVTEMLGQNVLAKDVAMHALSLAMSLCCGLRAHRVCVIAASAVAVQASSLEDAACSLKKGECDGKEIELNKLLIGPLCVCPLLYSTTSTTTE
jgi:hypothetical protein